MRTLRTDYVLTAGEWLRRLRECGETIKERWGEALYDDYDHYLRSCVWAFELSYLSVHQLSLGRIDEKGGPRA
jgi:cyclopropane-fatty-acyl-phospholipid synthase